jgi:hypothetical protein
VDRQTQGARGPAGASVWFRLTVPSWEPFAIDTRGSDYDTMLAVFEDTSWGSFPPVCEDDTYGLRAMVRRHGSPSSTYWIQVTGAGGATGTLRLAVHRLTGRLEGRVVDDATGQPPTDFVCVRAHDQHGQSHLYGVTLGLDGPGSYRFDHLPDGTYRLLAEDCNWRGPKVYAPAWFGGSSAETAAEIEVVDGATTKPPVLRLRRGGVVSGRVVDETGAPLRSCVSARRLDTGAYGSSSATTDADGRYDVGGLGTGRHELSVSDCTFPSSLLPVRFEVDVVQGQRVAVADVVPVRAAELRGRVVDAAGAPVGGTCVNVRSEGATMTYGASTAADGTYRVTGLPAAAYRVLFAACGRTTGAFEFYEDAGTEERTSPRCAWRSLTPPRRRPSGTASRA